MMQMICIETQDISENSVVVQAANKVYYFHSDFHLTVKMTGKRDVESGLRN